MKEVIEIIVETINLLDRLLDIDEKESDVCSPAQNKHITDFRNFLSLLANHLQNKDDKHLPQQHKEVILAPCVDTEDDNTDGGADTYLRREKKADWELG
jgi:hypothetical protein